MSWRKQLGAVDTGWLLPPLPRMRGWCCRGAWGPGACLLVAALRVLVWLWNEWTSRTNVLLHRDMTGTKNILTSLVEMFKSYHKRLEIKKNNNTWAIRKHLESGQEQGWAERTSACPGLPIQQTTPRCRCEQVCSLLGWNSKPSLHMKDLWVWEDSKQRL